MTQVSVIIPTYNRPKTLKLAVQSVIAQGFAAMEIIIVDDASDAVYAEDIRKVSTLGSNISLVTHKERQGASACRNTGIAYCAGEYLLFLDDDDILLPHMIHRQYEYFSMHEVDAVSCRSEVVGKGIPSRRLRSYNWQQQASLSTYDMSDRPFEHIFLYHPQIHTFMVRRSAIGDIRFSENLTYGEDILFWLKLAAQGLKFRKLDFVGCRYQFHQASTSYKATYAAKLNFYQALKHLPLRAEVENLRWLRLSYLALRCGNIRGLGWLLRAFSRPVLFIRHVRHYLRIHWVAQT